MFGKRNDGSQEQNKGNKCSRIKTESQCYTYNTGRPYTCCRGQAFDYVIILYHNHTIQKYILLS